MRLVDANRIMETVKALENKDGEYADSFTNMAGNRSIEFDRLKDYIENAPTVNADTVVHAHWIEHRADNGNMHYVCSRCGKEVSYPYAKKRWKYCIECGAKMDEEAE